jgi:hypothetical protein
MTPFSLFSFLTHRTLDHLGSVLAADQRSTSSGVQRRISSVPVRFPVLPCCRNEDSDNTYTACLYTASTWTCSRRLRVLASPPSPSTHSGAFTSPSAVPVSTSRASVTWSLSFRPLRPRGFTSLLGRVLTSTLRPLVAVSRDGVLVTLVYGARATQATPRPGKTTLGLFFLRPTYFHPFDIWLQRHWQDHCEVPIHKRWTDHPCSSRK